MVHGPHPDLPGVNVAFSIRPVDGAFYQLFTESAQHLVRGSGLLAEMFAAGTDRATKAKEMREAESEADATTRSIVQRVNKTFVTPFDREDIHDLAYRLDDVMDEMEKAADLINLYGIDEFPVEFAKQVELIQRCAELTAAAMPRLQSLDVDEYWLEIGRLEKAGDKSYRRMISKLFGGSYDAIEVLKLKDVVDTLESTINAFETVAKQVEQIAVKES
jgi:predicted phosphate transport protein (TIGR00153 family)